MRYRIEIDAESPLPYKIVDSLGETFPMWHLTREIAVQECQALERKHLQYPKQKDLFAEAQMWGETFAKAFPEIPCISAANLKLSH
jgi:hypothetical protein